MYKRVEFTRDELYGMVWGRPLLVVAKEIGVSEIALSKACRRAEIPVPRSGYWAASERSQPPPLVEVKSDQRTLIRFSVRDAPPARPKELISQNVRPIRVPTQLRKPHSLVAAFHAAAKGAVEEKGVLALDYTKVLRVRASRRQVARASILMDTLIKAFESRGLEVRIGKRPGTELVLKEGVISFRLDERTKQTDPPPLPPRPAGGRYSAYYEPWRPAFVLVATGEFTLAFERYRLHGCRHTWQDRAGSALEARLHEVLAAIPSWEDALKAQRLDKERQEAKAIEAEACRVEKAREREVLRRQRQRLVSNLSAWERAERLRRFIAEAQKTWCPNDETLAWLDWASAQVLALDPLCSETPVVTNLDIKLEDHFTGHPNWEKPAKDWWSE